MPCKSGIYCQRKADCQDLTCPGRPSACQQVTKESIETNLTWVTMIDKAAYPYHLHYSNDDWQTVYAYTLSLFEHIKLFLGVTTLAKIIQNKHKP